MSEIREVKSELDDFDENFYAIFGQAFSDIPIVSLLDDDEET